MHFKNVFNTSLQAVDSVCKANTFSLGTYIESENTLFNSLSYRKRQNVYTLQLANCFFWNESRFGQMLRVETVVKNLSRGWSRRTVYAYCY